MIVVDKLRFAEQQFQTRFAELAEMQETASPRGRLYALCLKHPFDLLSTVLFLKQHGGSALLLSDETPLHTAQMLAERAGCAFLLYGQYNQVLALPGEPRIAAPSLLQYSSGTTGQPKLIQRTWEQVDREIAAYNQAVAWNGDERPLILVPVSHSFGLISGVLSALARGAEPVIAADKNPKFYAHLVKNTEHAVVYGVPFLFHIMLSLQKNELAFYKLVSSGSPLSDDLLRRLSVCSGQVLQQYGCSEAGCLTIADSPRSYADVGRPLPHVGLRLQPHADGVQEIVAAIGDSDIATGDMGAIAEDGRLLVYGRMDDLINVSGLKVIPSEVEQVLASLDGVRECVVYRTQHVVWGEAVKALVVPDKPLTKQEARAWCIQHLPAYKVPSVIDLVERIPRMPSGKISRKLLIEMESV